MSDAPLSDAGRLDRRHALGAMVGSVGLFATRPVHALTHPPTNEVGRRRRIPPQTPHEALAALLAGNRRYMLGEPLRPHQDAHRREQTGSEQHPFAAVFGCVDSRVPPELLFDAGLGDLFVMRSAAHILDDAELGSIEFGVEELHIPLVLVLGHERCGAIKAALALSGGPRPPDRIGMLVDALAPAMAAARDRPGDPVENVIHAQVELTVRRLHETPMLAERMRAGALDVVGARYDLDTGHVALIGQAGHGPGVALRS